MNLAKQTRTMKQLLFISILSVLSFCGSYGGDGNDEKDISGGSVYPEERAFLEEAARLYDRGEDCTDRGFALQAGFYYGQAVVAVASFRYAVNELILIHKKKADEKAEQARKEAKKKQEEEDQEDWDDWETEDEGGFLTAITKLADQLEPLAQKADSIGKINDAKEEAKEIKSMWDQIAAQSLSSPYPYFFEGVLFDYQGKKKEAAECYANALMNPNYPEKPWNFRFLADLSRKELKALSRRLREKEDILRQPFALNTSFYKRDYRNWDDAYLYSLATDTLKADTTAVGIALKHYEAALRANPFEPTYFAGCAYLSARMGDGKQAAYYINEGLLLDPGHEGLNILLKAFNKKGGKP